MQKSNIRLIRYCSEANLMLQSRIDPDLNHKSNKNKYIIHKIPKADKKLIADYQTRLNCKHPKVPNIFIQTNSIFYHSVYIQTYTQFTHKHFNMVANNKKLKVLIDLLEAVQFLVKIYGFFYINENMVGYNDYGSIALWIHENLIQNKPKYPIIHGKLSQEIFISDFKHTFAAYLKQQRQFKKIKTIDCFIDFLNKKKTTAQSINFSEPAFWARNQSRIAPYDASCRQSFNIGDYSGQFSNMNRFNFSNNTKASSIGKKGLNTLKKSISFSYLPNQQQKQIISPSNLSSRALSPTSSLQNLLFNGQGVNKLNMSNNSVYYSKILQKSTSQQSLTTSFIPKVQFTYKNSIIQGGWKKKNQVQTSNINTYSSKILSQSQSLVNLRAKSQNQPLKISFPHTTAHSFVPFSSNGNISLNFKQSANFQRKGIKIVKQDGNDQLKQMQQQISEKSNQLQMDLQILFSDSQQQLHSREQIQKMEMIMEQFENILLS